MALTATTLAAALGANDAVMTVTSATYMVVGNLARVDDEIVKILTVDGVAIGIGRGKRGTLAVAHSALAALVTGLVSDFATLKTIGPVAVPPRTYTYGGPGAITVAPGLHFLNGASTDAMTIAVPALDEDGMALTIMARAAHAYVLTAAAAFGGTTSTIATFTSAAIGDNLRLVACGGVWNIVDTYGTISLS
jgi:hypothetical protein